MRLLRYQWSEVSLSEANRLRAFAILLIVIHNFLHWVMSSPGENEFSYSAEKFQNFRDGLWNHPYDCVRIIFSYLGHYGVQVFFFLSGYGVAMKYGDTPPKWGAFVRRRLSALYPAILIAAAGYLLYDGLRLGWGEVFQQEGVNLVRQIVAVSNFIPDNIYHPIGPWWFIGVIVQFYLIAPFLLKQRKWQPSSFLLVVIAGSILIEWLLGPVLEKQCSLNINHTILGHLDVCALGMLLAQYKKLSIPLWVFALAGALFAWGNYGPTMWIVSGLAMTVMLVPVLRFCARFFEKYKILDSAIVYAGGLSMYLFLCNGYLRNPLITFAKKDPVWWKSIALCLIFLVLVFIWAAMLRWLEKKIRRLFGSN